MARGQRSFVQTFWRDVTRNYAITGNAEFSRHQSNPQSRFKQQCTIEKSGPGTYKEAVAQFGKLFQTLRVDLAAPLGSLYPTEKLLRAPGYEEASNAVSYFIKMHVGTTFNRLVTALTSDATPASRLLAVKYLGECFSTSNAEDAINSLMEVFQEFSSTQLEDLMFEVNALQFHPQFDTMRRQHDANADTVHPADLLDSLLLAIKNKLNLVLVGEAANARISAVREQEERIWQQRMLEREALHQQREAEAQALRQQQEAVRVRQQQLAQQAATLALAQKAQVKLETDTTHELKLFLGCYKDELAFSPGNAAKVLSRLTEMLETAEPEVAEKCYRMDLTAPGNITRTMKNRSFVKTFPISSLPAEKKCAIQQ
ncbi:MAG: hypothetical protein ACRYF5_19140 [Janthinobacterium lividum]